MTEPNYEQVDCDQPLPEGRIRELAEGKANPWPIDSQILAREVLALRAKLAECVGNPLAGNPAEWGHADQIAGLGAQLITTRAKLAEVEIDRDNLWRALELERDRMDWIARALDGFTRSPMVTDAEWTALQAKADFIFGTRWPFGVHHKDLLR